MVPADLENLEKVWNFKIKIQAWKKYGISIPTLKSAWIYENVYTQPAWTWNNLRFVDFKI